MHLHMWTHTHSHTHTPTRRIRSIPAWGHNKKHLILSHSEPDSHTLTHAHTHTHTHGSNSSFFPQEPFHHQCPLTWLLGQTGSLIHHKSFNLTWSIHYTHKQLPSLTHRPFASSFPQLLPQLLPLVLLPSLMSLRVCCRWAGAWGGDSCVPPPRVCFLCASWHRMIVDENIHMLTETPGHAFTSG